MGVIYECSRCEYAAENINTNFNNIMDIVRCIKCGSLCREYHGCAIGHGFHSMSVPQSDEIL